MLMRVSVMEPVLEHDMGSSVIFLTRPCFGCNLADLAGNSSVGSFCVSENSEAPI